MEAADLKVGMVVKFAGRGPYKILAVRGNMATFRDEKGISTDAPADILEPLSIGETIEMIRARSGATPTPSFTAPAPASAPSAGVPYGEWGADRIGAKGFLGRYGILVVGGIVLVGVAWFLGRRK